MDDTVGQFASTMAGVGTALAKENYFSKDFVLFFESLKYIYELEEQQYNKMDLS